MVSPHIPLIRQLTVTVLLGSHIIPRAISYEGIPTYPDARIGDFGLSRTTTMEDGDWTNRARYLFGGTRLWAAPEQRLNDIRCQWIFSEGQDPWTDPGDHKAIPQTNLWAIAAIMWSLITGQEISDLHYGITPILNKPYPGSDPYTAVLNGSSSYLRQHYSNDLLNLVTDCLKLLPEQRPSLEELRDRISVGMTNAVAEANGPFNRHHGSTARLEVAYKYNEIARYAVGTANYDLNEEFWDNFVRGTLFTPEEWGPLHPPTAPPALFQPPAGWSPALQQRWVEKMARAEPRPLKRRREDSETPKKPEKSPKRTKRQGKVDRIAKRLQGVLDRGMAALQGQPRTRAADIVTTGEGPGHQAGHPVANGSSDTSADRVYRPALGGLVDPTARDAAVKKTEPRRKRRSSSNEGQARSSRRGRKQPRRVY
jgi:hypothetical protein